MNITTMLPAACLLFAVSSWAEVPLTAPKPKPLVPAIDPTKKEVPIGRVVTGKMDFQLSLEGSEAMWMSMGTPPAWGAHAPQAAERFHVELKLTDPRSKTRIPYANVSFNATNVDTGKTMTLLLPPMWGSSGLHYSANSALLGDGTYAVTTTVDVPTFQRELKDKDLWSTPVSARFHFKLTDGKVTEVSTPNR
ncbi:iron transporter [Roseateles sp.]|uniref:iron transporter n=1 Tax=Roseateles sp. TaxID=1971397 RepID=UPI00286C51B3|nr:iron transporter [Roseateles sp.]